MFRCRRPCRNNPGTCPECNSPRWSRRPSLDYEAAYIAFDTDPRPVGTCRLSFRGTWTDWPRISFFHMYSRPSWVPSASHYPLIQNMPPSDRRQTTASRHSRLRRLPNIRLPLNWNWTSADWAHPRPACTFQTSDSSQENAWILPACSAIDSPSTRA